MSAKFWQFSFIPLKHTLRHKVNGIRKGPKIKHLTGNNFLSANYVLLYQTQKWNLTFAVVGATLSNTSCGCHFVIFDGNLQCRLITWPHTGRYSFIVFLKNKYTKKSQAIWKNIHTVYLFKTQQMYDNNRGKNKNEHLGPEKGGIISKGKETIKKKVTQRSQWTSWGLPRF